MGTLSAAPSTVPSVTTGSKVDQVPCAPAGLNDEDLSMLELERSWWKHQAAKESLVRERFDISPTVYYARLNELIDRPEAMAADAMTVRRLQRLREQRRQQRSGARLGV